MRIAEDADSVEVVHSGDPALAEQLAAALAHRGPVERATHGFHTYPAGLHPDAARDLLALMPGDGVLDPFCGGGTVLVEARLAGRQAWGRDLSTVAVRVARARTATPDDATLTALRSTARRLTAEARAARELPPEPILHAVERWYAPHALSELWSIRAGLDAVEEPVRGWLEAVLSSILVKVSWRRSDTSAKRETHRRPPGTTAVLFHKKTRELARKMAELRDALPEGAPPARVGVGDAREVHTTEPVDAVLTSPPYPSTYDYLALQHLRRVWLGKHPRELGEREIGARRQWRERGNRAAVRQWVEDTHTWTAATARNLRDGGRMAVVVGDGLTPAGPVDTRRATTEAVTAAGLRPLASASLARPDHARQTTRWEHVLLFERSGAGVS